MNHWIRPAHLQIILIFLFVKGDRFSGVNGLTPKDPLPKGSSNSERYPWDEFVDEGIEEVSNADIYQSLNYLIGLMVEVLTKLHEEELLPGGSSYSDIYLENPASWSVLLPPNSHRSQCCPPIWPDASNPDSLNRYAPSFKPPPINSEDRTNQAMYPQHFSENPLTVPYIPFSPPPFFGADQFAPFADSVQIPDDKYDMFPMLPQPMSRNSQAYPSSNQLGKTSHLRRISVNPPPINPDDTISMPDVLFPMESRNNELYSTVYRGYKEPTRIGLPKHVYELYWPWNHEFK